MDIRTIRKLIDLIEETGVNEIEIREGESSVRISKQASSACPPQQTSPAVQTYVTASPAAPTQETSAPVKSDKPADKEPHSVTSPMVGTFYVASSPGSAPLVSVGQTVEVGDILCVVEAMKMFNQIEADRAGTVTARLVENGQAVEFGQALFLIED